MASVYQVAKKKQAILLVVLLMLLPVLLVAGVLLRTFSEQIKDSYEKRLSSSLSVLELTIQRGVDDFRNSLSRLAADNTLQVTVDLDIRPQLKRYLSAQFAIAGYQYIEVADKDGNPLATLGALDLAKLGCEYRQKQQSETMLVENGLLVFNRSVPLYYQKRFLGYLCAGYAINSVQATASVTPRIDGLAQLGWGGVLVPYGGDITVSLPDIPTGEVFDIQSSGIRYRGEAADFMLNDRMLQIYALVDMHQYDELLTRSVWITAFVVLAILVVALFALKMLGQRQRAVSELQVEREKAVITLASIADGVVTLDQDGYITYVNSAAKQILSSDLDHLLGVPWQEAFDLQNEVTGERVLNLSSTVGEINSLGAVDSILVTNDGRRTAVHFSVAQIDKDKRCTGFVVTLRNTQKERELRRRLAWKASRDDLTGLLNRSEFARSIKDTIESIEDDATHHCLLYIDLDEFKVVNDTCGHRAGDKLLQNVSASLKTHLRESDIVARLGGDEFGVLLRDCGREKGIEVSNELIEAINDIRFAYQEKVFHIGASIGLVSVTSKTTNLEDLQATVDAACYAAKEEGRNRVFVGQIDGDKISSRMEELRQASHIRHALKEGRMMLYHQPIVATLNPGKVLHSEILVRMIDSDGTLVVPGAFIPIAERHGLMQEVDRWIIRHLFEIEGDRLRRWKPLGSDGPSAHGDFIYSINLSASSLTDPTFLDYVKEQLKVHRIHGRAIAFEITETQVITHLDKAASLIRSLRELGCKFLLDDFGSGMSSFGYLKRLPIDYLKIDGLFVRDILSDPIDRSMVNMINEIGRIMGLKTVAEYVENDEILEELKAIGVDMAQGYGIAEPSPLEEMPGIRNSGIA